MNIFTVTFLINNYGSVLQAYALQSRLKECGAKPCIILHARKKNCTVVSRIRSILGLLKPRKHYSLIQRIQLRLQSKKFSEKNKKISSFIQNHIKVKSLTDLDEFSRTVLPTDVFLAGSDQIWNTMDKPLSNWYSLQWYNGNNKKYSYAASIGQSALTEKQIQDYEEGLSSFTCLSFREIHAVNALSSSFSDKIRNDLDPTLLYDGSFWRRLKSSIKEKEPYIFVYMLRPDDDLIKLALKIGKEKKCNILYTGNYAYQYDGINTILDAGIEDFLSYIDNAEAIVTNSFHGTVFSILFEKPFLSVKIASTSSRVESMLGMLGLMSQLVSSTTETYSFSINYAEVMSILDIKRNESLQYLKTICN